MVKQEPKSPAAEAIRSLRTNLQYVSLDRPLKHVMVTSAGPDEGKTSIVANLAASLAESGRRTLAVGVDLRKPTLHKVFDLPNRVGLTNVLLGQLRLREALQETGVEGLKLLDAGPVPPNPAELIGSAAMADVVKEINDSCDIAIYDAPPVMAVTDAVLLSRHMDGVLLVVAINETPRELVTRAKEQLEQVQARVLGVVANRVPVSGQDYYYYYYYYSNDGDTDAGKRRLNGHARPSLSRMLARLVGRGVPR